MLNHALDKLAAWMRARLHGRRFLSNVLVLAGGTAAAHGVTLAAEPILTRLYSPVQFGICAAFASAAGILQSISSGRYERAIPIPRDERSSLGLLYLCFLILVCATALGQVVAWLFGEPLLRWANIPQLRPYLWLVPAGLFFGSAYEVLSMWTIRTKEFTVLASTKLRRSGGTALTQLALGGLAAGPLGLIAGDMVGRILGLGALAGPIWRKHRPTMRKISPADIKDLAVRYRRFPMLSTPAALLNRSAERLPAFLLLAFYGPAETGWYWLCQRALSVPVTLISQSVARVYIGEASEAVRTSPERLKGLFLRVGWKLFLFSLPPSAVLVAFGPWLFRIVFGPSWVEAGEYARALGVNLPFLMCIAPLTQTLFIVERQELLLIGELARVIMIVGSMYVVCSRGLPALTAVWTYSIAAIASYSVQAGMIAWALWGKKHPNVRED